MNNYDVTFILDIGKEPVVIKVHAGSALAAFRTAVYAAERDKVIPAETVDLLVEAKKV